MTKTYDAGVRPAAIDHVFFDQMKTPSFNSVFSKSVYWGFLSRSVATFNPKYAFFYGFARASTDFLTAAIQYNICFDGNYGHKEQDDFDSNPLLKTLYCAVNIFGSMLILYSICKVGELVYWGGKSLIGRADYRSFGLLDLIKIESMIALFTVTIDFGLNALDSSVRNGSSSRRDESSYYSKTF